MKEKNIYVDIEDMKSKKELMDQKYNELVGLFKNYKKMIEETKDIYDTESAKYFRNIALNYMDVVDVKLENEFKMYIDKLDEVVKNYSDYSALISNKINGKGDNYEV